MKRTWLGHQFALNAALILWFSNDNSTPSLQFFAFSVDRLNSGNHITPVEPCSQVDEFALLTTKGKPSLGRDRAFEEFATGWTFHRIHQLVLGLESLLLVLLGVLSLALLSLFVSLGFAASASALADCLYESLR